MVQVHSKFARLGVSCQNYVHPWTDSCSQAATGLFLYAVVDSLRIYSTVYILALLMRGKIPNLEEIKKTMKGIFQSTAFLSSTSMMYSIFLCLFRKWLGFYNIFTISGLPIFVSCVFNIFLERPSRRGLLALYVSNVATETAWNMMVSRNMVKSIKHGQVALFAGSAAILLALAKAGYHKMGSDHPDSMFTIFRFVMGPYEEKDSGASPSQNNSIHREQVSGSNDTGSSRWQSSRKKRNIVYNLVMQALRMYKKLVYKIKCCDRYNICPHPFSCLYYVLHGSTKMFSTGLGLQLALKLVLNMKTVIKSPKRLKDIIFKRSNLNIAIFLGGASGLYRAIMCLLRRVTDKDDAGHALIGGLIAGLAFIKYPDTTIALYVFWKTLHIVYNLGVLKGYVPNVPGFTVFLYCISTAILFHAATVEPLTLRQSYWKFLHSLSGGRIAVMAREPMDVWGLETSKALQEILRRSKTKAVVSRYLIK